MKPIKMKKMDSTKKEALEGYLMIFPLFAGCLVFYAIPFALVLQSSVFNGAGHSLQFVGWNNYVSMLRNSSFRLAFGNTLRFLLIALPLILIISYAIALLLKNHAQKHKWLKSVLLLPYTMPIAGTVLIVELVFEQNGLLNSAFYTLGLPVSDWLNSDFAFVSVVLLYLWKNAGYSVILLLSGLMTIPEDQYDAAAIDGATIIQQLRFVTVPQMWYSLFFATVFSLINAFKCFREIFLIGGTHPHDSIYMLQHYINNAFENVSYHRLAVASVLLLVILTVLFASGYSWVMKKEAYKE